jgi:biopolymer transport protein ExbB
MLIFNLQVGGTLTQVAADSLATGIQSPEVPAETRISLIDMIWKGGPVMIPIAILMVVAIYILIERLLVIGKASKRNESLIPSIKEMIQSGNLQNALAMCRNMNTPESTMLAQGVARIGQPVQEIRTAMDKSGSVEIMKLEKNMNILNIIGRVAPMVGFIGTIVGVIVIFYDISLAKSVEIDIISKGLYQKMVNSAGGLVVGVIAFIFYHWLNGRIDKLAHRMEEAQIRLLDILNEPAK